MFFILEKVFFDLGPIIFGIAGFLLASYVYTKKQKQENLVCPMNGSCDEVVNSRYSKFLGVPVEVMGMFYYAFIVLIYSYIFLNGNTVSDLFKFFVTGITVGAFFFSVYLIIIQAFILRMWCTWCLFSAGFTTFIFVTAVFGTDLSLVLLLAKYKGIIVFFHAFAAAIGVGAATITDIFFFRYLKDYKISEPEHKTMETLSAVIWVALGVLVLTGIGLFIPQSERLLESSKFLTKAVAVGVLIINGIMLNLAISPRMMEITFGDNFSHQKGELHFMRKLSFALGAISITSWYVIFILGSLKSIPVSIGTGISLYILLICVAVIGSQIFDRMMIMKRKKDLENNK
jgi:uncharacterized membrane protein